MSRRKLTIGILVLVLASALLSYFEKYTPDLAPIVDPYYETNSPELQNSRDPQFVNKVMTSNIGMVLVHSDYSSKNATALESLRTWAKERFSQDAQFLHPVSVRYSEHHDTVISAFFYNLFGPERSFLERSIKGLMRERIEDFHSTEAYESFRVDYYDLFGVDPEAATLLARYQEERAHAAIDVVYAFGCAFLAVLGGIAVFIRTSRTHWMSRGRLTLAYAWFASSIFYLAQAWQANQVAFLVTGILAFLVAAYLRRPIIVAFDETGFLDVRLSDLSQRTVTLAIWASVTLLCIQLLTWARSGNLIEPDPITLFVSSLTGNFLHDPANAKRLLDRSIGISWLVISLWSIYFFKRGDARTPEFDAQLEKLDHAAASR